MDIDRRHVNVARQRAADAGNGLVIVGASRSKPARDSGRRASARGNVVADGTRSAAAANPPSQFRPRQFNQRVLGRGMNRFASYRGADHDVATNCLETAWAASLA